MRLAEDVAELGTIEQRPHQDGRNMTMLLAPLKRKPQAEHGRRPDAGAAADPAGAGGIREPVAGVCFNKPSHAEDEDPLGRQEALQEDRQGQGPRPSRHHEPQPREEERQAQAPPRPPGRGRRQPTTSASRSCCTSEPRQAISPRAQEAPRRPSSGPRATAARRTSSYKRAKEALLKADTYAYRDRRNRKRDFRRLWITRINAAARQEGMTYSQFMHGLKLAGVELDRKVLADIAVRDPETFRRFAERAREAAAA